MLEGMLHSWERLNDEVAKTRSVTDGARTSPRAPHGQPASAPGVLGQYSNPPSALAAAGEPRPHKNGFGLAGRGGKGERAIPLAHCRWS